MEPTAENDWKGLPTRCDSRASQGNFLEHGPLRASLYRNKLNKIKFNPLEPLSNPYRMSTLDQMPVRVIPVSPAKKRHSVRRRSIMAVLTPGKRTALSRIEVSNKLPSHDCDKSDACQNCEGPSFGNVDSVLKQQNRAMSLDSLLHKPHYMTRHALKRITESTENESSPVCQKDNNFSEQSMIRGSKSRKSFHKFFKRTLKKDGENTLNEAKSLENLDLTFTDKSSKERNSHRKRRQSGFRSHFQKISLEERSKKRTCDAMEENLALRDVLKDKGLLEEFRSFLSSEHSEENLDFWVICEKFKTSHKRASLAKVIQRQFLLDGAPRQVNLDGATRSALLTSSPDETGKYLERAQNCIFQLMESDPFRRFSSQRQAKKRKF